MILGGRRIRLVLSFIDRRLGGSDGRTAKATGKVGRPEEVKGERTRDPVAWHTEPGRLGGVHRERYPVQATDPRGSHLGTPPQAPPVPDRTSPQTRGRAPGQRLVRVRSR